jgi:hypothetical protein
MAGSCGVRIRARRSALASQHLENLLLEFKAGDLYYLRESVAVLDKPEIERAIAESERLFAAMRRFPERAASCSARECPPQDLAAALALPEATHVAGSLNDDDGEALPYVVAYLKEHVAVLRHALGNDLVVLHGQSHRLDGSEA